MITRESVNERYREMLGNPSRSAEFVARDHTVEILKWDPSALASDVFLYATIGLSVHALVEEHEDHRAEFFTGLLPSEDNIAPGLAGTVFELIERSVAPQHGLTVTFEETLWHRSTFTGFVITRPLAEILKPQRFDGVHVEFYQLIPITFTEAEYIREHGYEKLRASWQLQTVPFWDPHRKSSI